MTRSRSVSLLLGAALAGTGLATTQAATLTTGSAVFDFDKASWSTLAGGSTAPGFELLLLDEVFDEAAAASRTASQIVGDEVQANPSYTGNVFAMNGAVVTNLTGRTAQPTNFSFAPGNLIGHSGVIGLGGVTRWDVNALVGGGNVLAGDFTLAYDANRLLVGGSGWALTNHIAPAAVVFDLTNVTANASGGTLTISGDLSLSYEVANFLLTSPGDQGKDMGNFTFTASYVPEASTATLLGLAFGGGILRRRRMFGRCRC